MDDELKDIELVFNGVDGQTGGYLYAPTSLSSLAAAIQRVQFESDSISELKYHNKEPRFGLIYGVEAEELSEAGWALISAEDTSPEVLSALAPLRELRHHQAGELYREFTGTDGYRHRDSKAAFLGRRGTASAMPVNPRKMPYYVLLVGGPESIPFSFQYQLDVQYAVGRIAFDTIEEYAGYASTVVTGDTACAPPTMRLFGPRNAADRATQLSARHLVAPLAESLNKKLDGWEVAAIPPEKSSKDGLADLLSGEDASILFTASHGVGFPHGHPLQRSTQGALVCQDWPGPLLSGGGFDEDYYFAATDAENLGDIRTRIMMSFACFGAGTPVRDDFAHISRPAGSVIAESPFIARLPQRLLAHPNGGMLAFVGHVERALGCSFITRRVGPQIDVFLSTLTALMDGWRVGHAMDFFNDRYSATTAQLHDSLDGVRQYGDKPDELEMTRLWTESNDARSYVVLGDPAVRLHSDT